MVTNDETTYHRALIFHDGGAVFRDHAAMMKVPFFAGLNFRMNEILSAILRVQLSRLDGMLDAMLTEKRLMMNALAGAGPFAFNPIHDVEGDCGTTLGLFFEDASVVRRFLELAHVAGVRADTPIDSGRHVYSNWEPVLKQQGAHHPALSAYSLAEAPVEYTKDMCPTTLNVLERTVYLYTHPTRPREELDAMIDKVRQAAAQL